MCVHVHVCAYTAHLFLQVEYIPRPLMCEHWACPDTGRLEVAYFIVPEHDDCRPHALNSDPNGPRVVLDVR